MLRRHVTRTLWRAVWLLAFHALRVWANDDAKERGDMVGDVRGRVRRNDEARRPVQRPERPRVEPGHRVRPWISATTRPPTPCSTSAHAKSSGSAS